MTTLIRNCRVLTLDAEDRKYPRADIPIDGDKIVAIGPGPLRDAESATIVEAAGKLAMSGLINAFSFAGEPACGRATKPAARAVHALRSPALRHREA